ncbi:tRNA (N(6)-L-threonylcarbamoyladenosine(37)-C(2))-methylthiotransferase MtaB [Alphaproteobacteria bacterium]|nr:tRNA (N(6)-L-threonylcarbamoyladenosine(37)-C(2))-methylthiotransferase MtaB [Alphaproteobacteria bacterium]GHS96757.1 tRNA (N(6)-L-threonylcarbamoyladenosine(37)-C(2))-methylthiotransferase MtaB [Alphaproteobacteria bacterium]
MAENSKEDPKVVTFGCRLNTLESEKIKQWLGEQEEQNVIVVNTCAVTAEAERQARQKIRHLKKAYPQKRIIVTGCSATLDPRSYENMPQVDRVLVNREKTPHSFDLSLLPPPSPHALPVFSALPSPLPSPSEFLSGFEQRVRAFLQIQTGCNNTCSFCVIRLARGKSVSFPFETILQQAKIFAEKGFCEINLTGIDIASYSEGDHNLGTLLRDLLQNLPDSVRFRLSSLDPAALSEELYEVMKNPRVLPHWHLSLQSGDPSVLRRMLRRHQPEDVRHLAQKIRTLRPEIALGADLIVGFPGETEDMFQKTCDLVRACNVSLLHIFPYSDRPHTVASQLGPKVTRAEKKERLQHLQILGQEILQKEMKNLVGQTVLVLLEKKKGGVFWGKTEHFFAVQAQGESLPLGTFLPLRLTHVLCEDGRFFLSGVSV